MQDPDQFWQFVRHRSGVRPPGSVNIGAQLPGEGEPDGTRQSPGPVEAVHDDCASARGTGRSEGWSEKTNSDGGSIGPSASGIGSCCSGCENSADDSMRVSLRGAALPHWYWIASDG